MTVTIKDVAKKAHVSIATVSLVLKNHRRISPATKKKVLKAVSDLNYHPSRIARGLVLKQTQNIGFLLTNDHFLRTEPFYTHIFLGSEFEARDHNYYVLLNTIPNNFNGCDNMPRFVLEKNVDGVIIAGKVPQQIISCLETVNIPMVFIDYYPPSGDYSAVLIDNVQGGEKATDYLIEYGHRHIRIVGGDIIHPSIRDRFQGYKIALEKNNVAMNMGLVVTRESTTDRDCGYHAAQMLFKKNIAFSAIFACNDAMALGAMQYLKENGKRIPQDISIIGFDDVVEDWISDPPLSSIRVPKIDLGAEGVRLLMEYFLNKKPKKVLVPVELIPRKSVAKINGKT
jgi:LacI family transcriptional regulator